MKEALDKLEVAVKMGGHVINPVRFEDNSKNKTILAHSIIYSPIQKGWYWKFRKGTEKGNQMIARTQKNDIQIMQIAYTSL